MDDGSNEPGWWAVGALVFTGIAFTAIATAAADYVLSLSRVREELPIVLGCLVGMPAAYRLHRAIWKRRHAVRARRRTDA